MKAEMSYINGSPSN